MVAKAQPYAENGVTISKASISAGDKITLTYQGLLAQSGADTIIAHIGYGDAWDDKSFIPMEANEAGFTASFKVLQANSLNVSFKDSADNWDNNSGQNYSFPVTAKKVKAEKKEAKPKAEKKEAKTTKTKKKEA